MHRGSRSTPLLLLLGVLTTLAVVSAQSGHWAYQSPERPTLPTVQAQDWPQNPIDAFVLRKLEAEQRTPSPRAEPAQLLRRLYLDLTGLPPFEQPMHVHDLNATILHLLGVDHKRLTFRFQGRDYRLTDVAGRVVPGILA